MSDQTRRSNTDEVKRIFYASGSVITGDTLAEAIVRYAEVLSQRDSSDTIDIPIALDSGDVGRAQLLIGPASQLVIVPEEGTFVEVEDDLTIAELARRAALLASPHPQQQQGSDALITDYANDYSDGTEAAT